MASLRWLDDVGRDVRQAARRLTASSGFTLFSTLTLAVGIGITTAVAAIVHAALGPPPGVPNIDRVVNVSHFRAGTLPIVGLSWPDYQDLRAQQTVFDGVAGWSFMDATTVANSTVDIGTGEIVGGDYFRVLGVRAVAGRTLGPSDDNATVSPAAVISDRLWQRMFDRAPSAIGSTVKINGLACTIVGIADPDFPGSVNGGIIQTHVWITLGTSRLLNQARSGHDFSETDRGRRWLFVKAKLADGRSIADAKADVRRIGRQLDAAFPLASDEPRDSRILYSVSRLWEAQPASAGRFDETTNRIARSLATVLLAAVGLVLLVACTNLANLTAARWTSRQHDIATRLALGASRRQIVRALAIETLLLGAAGIAGGVLLARGLMRVVAVDVPITRGIALRLEPHVDLFALLVAGSATVLAMVIAGLVPAWRATKASARAALADAGVATTTRWRGRRLLIVAQTGVSALLLVLAALCVRHVWAASAGPAGLDLRGVTLTHVDFLSQGYDEAHARHVLDAARTIVATQPGITRIAVSGGLPGLSTTLAGVMRSGDARPSYGQFIAMSPELFEAIGLHIEQGRAFDARDRTDATPTIIVDATLARRLFLDGLPIGRQVVLRRNPSAGEAPHADEVRTVVGVVSFADNADNQGVIYVPFDQVYAPELFLVARTTSSTPMAIAAVRQALRAVDPDLGVLDSGTAAAMLNDDSLFFEITGGIATMLGVVALGLAAAGLFGVLSHLVAMRTREIGVRMALGADARRIRQMILRQGITPIVLGLILGLGLGAIPRMALRPQFRGLLPAFDVAAVAAVSLLFALVGLAASYWPAARASRVDPNVALKNL